MLENGYFFASRIFAICVAEIAARMAASSHGRDAQYSWTQRDDRVILLRCMRVFISYSASDEKWADLLRRDLPREGIEVWNPKSEIAPGENWGLKYGRGLEASDAMIVLLSPDAAKSEWVRHEIEYALGSPRFKDRLIAVLVRPTADIPWILEKQHFIRATRDAEKTVREVAVALKKTRTVAAR